ncbi:toprim domain-containing protein [Spirosoma migulaei]
MNSEQAKKLSLPDLLARLGHSAEQVKKGGQELWYRSPFRKEEKPSLQVSMGRTGIWIWNDHGDTHGTVIDFVMRYQGYTSIKDALAFLDDLFQPGLFSPPAPRPQPKPGPDLFSFYQQSHRAAVENFLEDRQLEFIDAQPIRRSLILSYLSDERHIPPTLAKRYLQEVRYRNLATGREYFAFGMENQAGGYEIRVASNKHNFKSALKARDITIILGTGADRTTAHIFEGMTDFLSYLVLTNTDQLTDDAIIMHSLSSYDRTAAHIRTQDYQQLRTYLDNDKAGHQGTERFKADFGTKVLPQSEKFATHKDLNLYLQAQRGKSGNGRG